VADTQTLHGLDDVLRKLQSLPPEIVSKRGGPVRSALRKGGKVIQQAAIANLEANKDDTDSYVNTGLLAKSVALGRDPNPQRSGANERYRIFVRRKTYPDGKKTIAAARYLEFGTEKMAPKPWLLPAFLANKERALATVVDELNKGIERIIRKLGR
jgi:HK97 gp10 family phage protein